MKKLHVHVSVNDIQESKLFYSNLFDSEPTIEHPDYMKWQLVEPAVNFAISQRGHQSGVNHLGIQVESDEELHAFSDRIQVGDAAAQKGAECCYAISDKYWSVDPQGIAWEVFHSLQSVPLFGSDNSVTKSSASCCIPG